MSAFTAAELRYLTDATPQLLGRLATVGADGTPHAVPTGWSYDPQSDAVIVGGFDMARTKKYRDAVRTGMATIVIDDVLPPWQPRGIEIRAHVEVIDGPNPQLRLIPRRIVAWGLDTHQIGETYARDVEPREPQRP